MAVQPSPSLTEMLRALERQNRPLHLGEGDVNTSRVFNNIAIQHILKGALAALSQAGMENSLIKLAEEAIVAINASNLIGAAGKGHVAMEILALFNGATKTAPGSTPPPAASPEPAAPKEPPVRLVLAPPKPKAKSRSSKRG